MTDREYSPIDCSLHDRLEQIATLGRRVHIAYRTERANGGEAEEQILDVFTRDGVELVRLGDGREIRLDDLSEVDGVSFRQEGS
jgi:Rho-binding antiterminator